MKGTEAYQVRCDQCQTSFAPETKRCVHCGGPLGRSSLFGGYHRQAEPPLSALPSDEMAIPYEHDDESDELKVQSRGRNVVWVLTAVLAVGMSILRTCGNGG